MASASSSSSPCSFLAIANRNGNRNGIRNGNGAPKPPSLLPRPRRFQSFLVSFSPPPSSCIPSSRFLLPFRFRSMVNADADADADADGPSYRSPYSSPGGEGENNVFAPPSNIPPAPPEWKDWEERRIEEMVAKQGISIRRRPPTGQPRHNVGAFQFLLQNEGNTPRNVLEEIIWNKESEVTSMKEKTPLITLHKSLPTAPPLRDFIGSLKARAQSTGLPALIAEVKKASPSRGVIQPDFDPVKIAQAYEAGGAACISVLTDSKYFQGSFENLKAIRDAGVQCPLLCKEFIIDAWQLYYARIKGADAVLLIAAVLTDQDLIYMSRICKMLGLAALVEVHDKRELDRVLGIDGIQLIGINNRNLATFKVDINNTVDLLQGECGRSIREKDILVVGESGLFSPEDIQLVQSAGVNAVLVGESLVKQSDPMTGIAKLFGKDISCNKPEAKAVC